MTDPQLPPTTALAPQPTRPVTNEHWYEYPIRVHPHHTDYAGIVWHGTYITWLEEARVECLRSIGIDFASLVELGCDLPVVELSLRYHQPLRLGMQAVVRARTSGMDGVRILWDYQITDPEGRQVYVTGRVTLVTVDREKGKILRKLPPVVENALVKLTRSPA